MGGDPRRPEIVELIQLGEEMLAAEEPGQEMHLVDLVEAAQLHRMLVERGIDDGIDLPGLDQLDGELQAPQRIEPRGPARLAEADRADLRRRNADQDRRRPVGSGCRARAAKAGRQIDAGHLGARGQHLGRADDGEADVGAIGHPRQQLGDDLGADAGRIAQQQSYPRPRHGSLSSVIRF